MRKPEEVMTMASDAGVTISSDITVISEVKTVQKMFEQQEGAIGVFQKKKGKPQKKITAYAIAKPGHIEKMVYALVTPDTDLRELFRKVKGYENIS